MKKYIFLILLSNFCTYAQHQFVEVNDSIIAQKLNEVPIIKNDRKYRGRTSLFFDCGFKKKEIKFSDNSSNENYVKFEELGVIKNTIKVIQKTDYNSEKFILLNTKSCKQIALEGFPLQIENTENYIVLNNPGTDESYKIQILEFKNDFFEIKYQISIPKEIIFKKILKVSTKELFVLDINNNIWKSKL